MVNLCGLGMCREVLLVAMVMCGVGMWVFVGRSYW